MYVAADLPLVWSRAFRESLAGRARCVEVLDAVANSEILDGLPGAVAPLLDPVFNRAKSDNKYRQYSAARVPAITQAATPTRRSYPMAVTARWPMVTPPGAWFCSA